MKNVLLLLSACFIVSSLSCKHTDPVVEKDPDPVVSDLAFFSQTNIAFRASHSECLLQQWYNNKYKNEPPIVFRVINDAATYSAFFPCSLTTPLPTIDFTTNSLLIGMKADNGRFVNSPVNISIIQQNLIQTSNDVYSLQVKVTGKQATSGYGTEWFAFMSVVPKITGTVNLDLQYQFK